MMLVRNLLCVFAALITLGPSVARSQSSPPGLYSGDTVWDWYNHAADLPPLCGASSWFELHPDESIADKGCVEAAMRQLGASESAVRFFESTTQFLNGFSARGLIDFGQASTPWRNMGRGEAVLLNGAPSAILVSDVLSLSDPDWKSRPGYADLLQLHPRAFPWAEYGGPVSERQSEDGGVSVSAAFEMRECRACAIVATYRIDIQFAPSGFIANVTVLPPGPPAEFSPVPSQ